MILRTVLSYKQHELNSYIRTRDPVNFGDKNIAILSNVIKQDGSFEFDDTINSDDH